jgi:hypothetical protein
MVIHFRHLACRFRPADGTARRRDGNAGQGRRCFQNETSLRILAALRERNLGTEGPHALDSEASHRPAQAVVMSITVPKALQVSQQPAATAV